MDYQDYKTRDHRLPPKADWGAVLYAIAIALVMVWALIEYIGADTLL